MELVGMLYILHIPKPWSSKFGAWGMLCIFYTCPTLILQILELGACSIFTHAQPWSSNSWSLQHAVYFDTLPTLFLQFSELGGMLDILHMPSLDPLNFGDWACCTLTHAQFWYPNFGACGMMYIWHMPTLILQNFGAWGGFYILLYVPRAQPQSSIFGGLRLGIVDCIHAKPWSYNFESLGACSLFYTCPALILSCIYTCPNKILQNFGA